MLHDEVLLLVGCHLVPPNDSNDIALLKTPHDKIRPCVMAITTCPSRQATIFYITNGNGEMKPITAHNQQGLTIIARPLRVEVKSRPSDIFRNLQVPYPRRAPRIPTDFQKLKRASQIRH